MDFIPSIQSRL